LMPSRKSIWEGKLGISAAGAMQAARRKLLLKAGATLQGLDFTCEYHCSFLDVDVLFVRTCLYVFGSCVSSDHVRCRGVGGGASVGEISRAAEGLS
jgi:hypothetical protein